VGAILPLVQEIVCDLEGDADREPEASQPLEQGKARTGESRTTHDRSGDQGRGFSFVDRLDARDTRIPGIKGEIVDLAPHEREGACSASQIARGKKQRFCGQVWRTVCQYFEGRSEKRVPGQDRDRLPERDMDGGAPTALDIVVHAGQVVVHQRIRVDELDGRRERERTLGRRTHGLCGCECKRRPQTLASWEKQVPHRCVEVLRRGAGFRQGTLQHGVHEGSALREVRSDVH